MVSSLPVVVVVVEVHVEVSEGVGAEASVRASWTEAYPDGGCYLVEGAEHY